MHPFDPLRAAALGTRDVLRVRDGETVSSRDHPDHVTAARVRGRLDTLVAAVRAGGAASA
ncbi:hypothetical protein [Streptomyces sp. NPDC054783]